MDNVLISFVILDIKNHYLAPLTIESILNQMEKRYEIIVMLKDISPHDFQILKEYTGKIYNITHTKEETKSKIMNEAIKLTRGRYLHFLFPGEIYLSKHSLSYVTKKIESKNFPDLLCFSFLRRNVLSHPEIVHVSFVLTPFGGERFPIFLKDCIFSKSVIEELNGFDIRYKGLEGFDMISKIYKRGKRVLCCRRVIVDFELQKISFKILKYVKELFSIIYKNFGIKAIFHWYVIREIFDIFLWWIKGIKSYFIQE
ncbi:MAG: hypothetical protein AMS24_01090 [Chlamydiae bacterium SM23_39]|nr:MAG: hypothetical protein AMS24_01090 [Chlamydiae bacterium SM23_39]